MIRASASRLLALLSASPIQRRGFIPPVTITAGRVRPLISAKLWEARPLTAPSTDDEPFWVTYQDDRVHLVRPLQVPFGQFGAVRHRAGHKVTDSCRAHLGRTTKTQEQHTISKVDQRPASLGAPDYRLRYAATDKVGSADPRVRWGRHSWTPGVSYVGAAGERTRTDLVNPDQRTDGIHKTATEYRTGPVRQCHRYRRRSSRRQPICPPSNRREARLRTTRPPRALSANLRVPAYEKALRRGGAGLSQLGLRDPDPTGAGQCCRSS